MMKKRLGFSIISLLFFLSLFVTVLSGCGPQHRSVTVPKAEKGVLDLSEWNFEKDGTIQLNGEWEFYWEQMLKPGDFTSPGKPDPTGFITLPGYWNRQDINNKKLPPFGCATLRLTVLHTPTEQQMGILTKQIPTSSSIYINDQCVLDSGKVAKERAEYIPNIQPKNASFHVKGDKFTITCIISNYIDVIGGSEFITMGLDSQIFTIRNQNIAMDLLFFGIFLMMGVYHLVLFFLRQEDKSLLYFGLFSLTLAMRTALMGERFFHQLLWFLGYRNLIIMEILAIPLAAVFFCLYFSTFYPVQFFKHANTVFLVISGIYSLASLFLPIPVTVAILPFYQGTVLVMGILITSLLVWAVLKRKEHAGFFAIGFFVFFASAVNDILYFNNVIHSTWILPLGLLLFTIIQAFLLSKKFTRAFYAVENLSTKLRTLNNLKDTFLINTSHELKNPLLGMMGLAETLLDGSAGPINDSQARNLSLITASGRRLLHLVNDLLDFARLKKKEVILNKQPIDMREICDVVFVFSRPFLSNKDITLVNKIPDDFPFVLGDEGRLQQIMNNLVGNAIKFTESGEIIVFAKQKGNMAFFSVKDTGIGIPVDKLKYIFKSFEQIGLADSSEKSGSKGTGIGLSITRQLVELQGGTIDISSTLGKGSTVTFSIPISHVQKKPEEKELPPSPLHEIHELDTVHDEETYKSVDGESIVGTRKKILLVDDDPSCHKLIQEFLDDKQFYLVHSMDGKNAIEKVNVENFDLLLLDLMMPGMSGYLVCKEIRKRFDSQELPIIFINEKNLVSDIIAGLKAGANDYISKPIRKSELVARINTHIQLSKVSKAYRRFIPRDFLSLLGRDSIIDVNLGDQVQREMTIMFSDIRSFMTLSERMSPKENFNFLNSYFEKIAPIIRKNHGYIDKYIGDGIMAIFPGHPEDALQSALEMKRAVRIYNSFRTKVGYVPISVGIGLHTGPIMLGTIGDETRMEGTVISDTVNVASRLEGLTKPYGGSIIISLAIFLALNDPSIYFYRFLGLVQVKGKREAVPIYEIFDNSDTEQKKMKTKDTFEKALQAYFSRKFKKAEAYFSEVCEIDPYDKAARLFLHRTQENQKKELPPHWEGVEKIEFT
jgi:two-component system, sensor histidine kinase ChiS